jgi:hypothetical protein
MCNQPVGCDAFCAVILLQAITRMPLSLRLWRRKLWDQLWDAQFFSLDKECL